MDPGNAAASSLRRILQPRALGRPRRNVMVIPTGSVVASAAANKVGCAPMAPPRRKRTSLEFGDEVIESVLAQLRERLSTEGAVKLSTLKPVALREALEPRLLEAGFELTPAFVRRPLAAQLHDALARNGAVASSDLGHVVRGATRAELEQTVLEAEKRGQLQRALRGRMEPAAPGRNAQRTDGCEWLVLATGQRVLDGERLATLRDTCTDLAKLLEAASKKKNVGLLASDVEHMLSAASRVLDDDSAPNTPPGADPSLTAREAAGPASRPRALLRGAAPSATAPRAADPLASLTRLLAAVDAVRDERTGMSFVPAIVQRLSSDMAVATAQEALLSAARQELIELRPEGGLGRLSGEELALCPPGPSGTRLSWARRSAEARA
jgi:hypothetical protein